MTIFLKFRFSLSGVRFGPRWPCACCFSIFSFVHFCGDSSDDSEDDRHSDDDIGLNGSEDEEIWMM